MNELINKSINKKSINKKLKLKLANETNAS